MNRDELLQMLTTGKDMSDPDVLIDKMMEAKREKRRELSHNPNVCKECKREDVIEDYKNGIMVCQSCGMVNSNVIDTGPEWRCANDPTKANPVRCNPVNPKVSSSTALTTMIQGDPKMQRLMMRNSMPYHERTMYLVGKMYEDRCQDAGINSVVIEKATEMYKSIYQAKKFNGKKEIHRGDKLKGLKAACLYLALLISGSRRPPGDIAKIMIVEVSVLNAATKKVIESLNLYSQLPGPMTHNDILDKFANSLKEENINIPFSLIRKAKITGNVALENKLLLEKVPKSIAAGCLWYVITHYTDMIEKKKITKKQIHKCTGVSAVTTQKIFDTLETISDKIKERINQN